MTAGFLVLIALAVVVIVCFSVSKTKNDNDSNSASQMTLKELPSREGSMSKSTTFSIAGINHHCYNSDIGPVSGQTIYDPENEYDRNAIMIVDANKSKLLGYISKNEQQRFRKIAGSADRLVFVGYIEQFINDRGDKMLMGVIRVYSGEEDIVIKDAQKDWDFLHAAFRIRDYEDRRKALKQLEWN